MRFARSHPAFYDLVFVSHGGGPDHEEATARYRRLAESPLREACSQGMIALQPERLATSSGPRRRRR